MLSDYFNGQQPKFEMGDYVYIRTHQKYGIITGRQYSPPPKNTFYYAIATSLDSYFQYFKKEVLTHIATMKYERDSRDNITSLYCEKFVEPLIFAQYVADFYLSLLQSLIQKFEAETEEIAYLFKTPSTSFVRYLALGVHKKHYGIPVSTTNICVEKDPPLRDSTFKIAYEERTWIKLV